MSGRCDARLQRGGPRNPRWVTTPGLVEHFFRHEYGRLVATLSRRVGVQHIEDVEDAVQSALMTALETWTVRRPARQPGRLALSRRV
jgi:predicted RNA polymerase sigma factor